MACAGQRKCSRRGGADGACRMKDGQPIELHGAGVRSRFASRSRTAISSLRSMVCAQESTTHARMHEKHPCLLRPHTALNTFHLLPTRPAPRFAPAWQRSTSLGLADASGPSQSSSRCTAPPAHPHAAPLAAHGPLHIVLLRRLEGHVQHEPSRHTTCRVHSSPWQEAARRPPVRLPHAARRGMLAATRQIARSGL